MSPWEFAMHWEVLRLPSPPKNDSAGAISRWINSEDDLADEEDQEFEPNPTEEQTSVVLPRDRRPRAATQNLVHETKREANGASAGEYTNARQAAR